MGRRATLSLATTHHVRDTCLCLHVQRAARQLARRFDEALKPAGLTHGQFSLMTSLNRATPPKIGDVAALLAMDRTTVTANLKPLERRGLVKVAADPDDRRSRVLSLTKAGRKTLAAALPLWIAAHAELERTLPRAAPDRLRAGLLAIS
jgi:DNA-binding MarR family transcriptional regulator